jgi:hypothetical protein
MESYTVRKPAGAAVILRELEPRLADCGDRFEVRLPGPEIHLIRTGSGFRYLPKPGKRPPKLRFAGLPAALMSRGMSSEEADRAAN